MDRNLEGSEEKLKSWPFLRRPGATTVTITLSFLLHLGLAQTVSHAQFARSVGFVPRKEHVL